MDVSERYWDKVDISGGDDCWEWKAYCDKYGYGIFQIQGRKIKAHRLALEIHMCRPIVNYLFVCHKCHNPSCVNPNHLYEGTAQDNVNDMLCAGRDNYTGPNSWPIGEDRVQAKLKRYAIDRIRSLYRTGNYSYRKLARMFDISAVQIGNIVKYKHWS